MNKLIDRIVKLPLTTKVLIVVGAVVALTLGNYFFIVSDLENQIVRNQGLLSKLRGEYNEKKYYADNLNEVRRQKEVLERRLAEALTELPASKDIDELLRQLNDVGKKSGLDIMTIEPGAEVSQGFYAAIPIKMQVVGNFHEIAVFFESVSKLRRIVNIGSLSLASPTRKSEKVVLTANYLATTFRFVEQAEAKEPKKK